ncbi:LuxR family transcriptional regulator [Rhodococcus sp. ZPP]|uniref:ATP-binding protein n=1 Tax=Rhodococcus sp. ZPP TaxID=2749906 RepID=UPI001AD873AB|nr:LuxR C-terminal-related transcriptional regulator [Rhodococcus sp. ZPP]QTJ67094.1 LuxR family transcriptional regulator [Rhodococcus sp. ZPP]
MTSFIGRRREIEEARARLQQSRLVSLLGVGGVGKTRLAEELAVRSARAFRDSVRWIDLASVRQPEAVPSAAAVALGVTDQSSRAVMDKVIDHVQSRHMLIVLDNCEHLLSAAAELVSTVLAAAPEVRIVTTSREPLSIAGEYVYMLPPLSTPGEIEDCRAADIAHFESVSLLVERAQSVVADFQLTDTNARAVAQLCNRLDGIPLAIELAAARLRSLSPSQLVERLDKRFALLTGGDRGAMPRQQTLRALIDWSFELCSDTERLLWARLSVFSGSFDLDAAEAICGFGDLSDTPVIDVLDRLIGKCLVTVDRTTEQLRYSQLMTVREYGHELLEKSGDSEELFHRHLEHYSTRADRSSIDWCGPGQSEILAGLRIDHPNFVAALDWSLRDASQRAAAARLAVALRYHWIAGGYLSDGRIRLERILQHLAAPTRERGDVLWVTAWTALIQGDHDAALAHLDECTHLATALGDHRLRAHADHWRGIHAVFSGKPADAIRLFHDAITVHRSLGDLASVLTASFELGMAQTYDGQLDSALRTCGEVIAVADAHGEKWNKAYALWVSSVAYFHLGRHDDAVEAAEQALRIQHDFKDKICTALSIELLSWVAASSGDAGGAATLSGAAKGVWRRLGTSVVAFGPHITEDSLTSERRAARTIGADEFARLAAPAVGLTIDQAVDLALGTRPDAAPTPPAEASPLTRREQQIAELLAEGLSNRQIADALVISRRTVDGHVEHILDKLAVSSRTQVAAWVAARAHPRIGQAGG